jgi:hypothetical protein
MIGTKLLLALQMMKKIPVMTNQKLTFLTVTKFIGVDPGSKGALCCLDSDTLEVTFHDTPHDHKTCALVQGWVNMHKPKIIGLERVHAIHGTSAGSNFKFGENLGMIKGVLYTTRIGIDYVPPKAWQKACGIAFKAKSTSAVKKKVVAAKAQELYPTAVLHGPRGGLLDGRADALMIAHHIMLKYGGKNG